MYQQAVEKLQTEIGQNQNNPYIQVVGKFLIQHISQHQGAAAQILTEGKTIAKSLDAMRDKAAKKKVGNYAVLTDQEGFETVLRYYGISTKDKTTEISPPVADVPKKPDFDVNLEDLL